MTQPDTKGIFIDDTLQLAGQSVFVILWCVASLKIPATDKLVQHGRIPRAAGAHELAESQNPDHALIDGRITPEFDAGGRSRTFENLPPVLCFFNECFGQQGLN
jgi:hypothetical protein